MGTYRPLPETREKLTERLRESGIAPSSARRLAEDSVRRVERHDAARAASRWRRPSTPRA